MKTASKLFLILYAIFGVLSIPGAIAVSLMIGLFGGWIPLIIMLLVIEVPTWGFFLIAFLFYKKQKYVGCFVFLALPCLALLVSGIYYFHSVPSNFRSRSTVASGFLVPSPQSVPTGFQATNPSYTNGAYIARYTDPSVQPYDAYIEFDEIKNLPARYNYTYTVGRWAQSSADQKVTNFTFDNHPGEVRVYNTTIGSENTTTYNLVWDDSGSLLKVTFFGVSAIQSPQDVVNVLNTMVRS